MRPPFSIGYVVIISALAVVAAVLGFALPGAGLDAAALLLGVYAVHLIALRIEARHHLTGRFVIRHAKAACLAEIEAGREQLEAERVALQRRETELSEKIAAAEEQWQLLRGMIRDRVEQGDRAAEGRLVHESTRAVEPDARTASTR